MTPFTIEDALRIAKEAGSLGSEYRNSVIEECAVTAWITVMDYHTKMLGMPCDAREVGSSASREIRALKKGGV